MILTGTDPNELRQRASKLKAQAEKFQKKLSKMRVEGSTGGGMVKVTIDGNNRVTGVVIDPSATEDIEMLQDMLRGAFNEAVNRSTDLYQQTYGSMMSNIMRKLGAVPG